MRSLGVVCWDGVTLGPAPVPGAGERRPATAREAEEAAVQASRARVRRMLGATGLQLDDATLDKLGLAIR